MGEWKPKVALKVLEYGAPLLAAQVLPTGPEDADALLEAEAGRQNGDDLTRLLAGGGPGPAAELRREWAAKLAEAEAEASDGDAYAATEGSTGAGGRRAPGREAD